MPLNTVHSASFVHSSSNSSGHDRAQLVALQTRYSIFVSTCLSIPCILPVLFIVAAVLLGMIEPNSLRYRLDIQECGTWSITIRIRQYWNFGRLLTFVETRNLQCSTCLSISCRNFGRLLTFVETRNLQCSTCLSISCILPVLFLVAAILGMIEPNSLRYRLDIQYSSPHASQYRAFCQFCS